MKTVGLKAETLATVTAFVAFFVVLDFFSTTLVVRHYGDRIWINEINAFVHVAGINGLASEKIGVLILALGAIVLFARYQLIVDEILAGLAVAGLLCGSSNLCLAYWGHVPGIGPFDAAFMSGIAIAIALMMALIDAVKAITGRSIFSVFQVNIVRR